MTGHFIVGETEEKGLISILLNEQQHTNACTSAFDEEVCMFYYVMTLPCLHMLWCLQPVEYFDQLNALMETAVTAMTLVSETEEN